MDAMNVVSHINEIVNSSLSNEEKIDRIQDEISDYFNELTEGDEE